MAVQNLHSNLEDSIESLSVGDTPGKENSVAKLLENETDLSRRIDITEKRFLEEIDALQDLKLSSDKEERIAIKTAELLLELEKVQIRRRKEEMESIINWEHLQATAQYFVRKLYESFDDMGVDAEIEEQILGKFMKDFESWEKDIVKEGVLERAA